MAAAGTILAAFGKTPDDLEQAVTRQRRLGELQAIIATAEELRQRRADFFAGRDTELSGLREAKNKAEAALLRFDAEGAAAIAEFTAEQQRIGAAKNEIAGLLGPRAPAKEYRPALGTDYHPGQELPAERPSEDMASPFDYDRS